MMMDRVVVTCLDEAGQWRPGVLQVTSGGAGIATGRESAEVMSGEDQLALEYLDGLAGVMPLKTGVVTGGFTDWHVHLHLIDWARLSGSPITRVHDLGGTPRDLQRIAGDGARAQLEVLHAGAFLTPPGGYPSDRTWAPVSSYREVSDPSEAVIAVQEMAAFGASAIKITSNGVAGPVFSDVVFEAIVSAARTARLPVVAHAEGPGEALRAARLGATRLAHAPFSEVLTSDEIAELAALTSWCSTLDIHGWGNYGTEYETAIANVAAFVRQGGRLLYGTDMGNGPTPVGLNPRELSALTAAGVTPEQQLQALTPGDPLPQCAELVWIPRDGKGQLVVTAARRLTLADLPTLTD